MPGESKGPQVTMKTVVDGLKGIELWVQGLYKALGNLPPTLPVPVPLAAASGGGTNVTGGNCPPPIPEGKKPGKKKPGKKPKKAKKKTKK